jgi:ribosome-associated translation inhibitor RaiA/cold shock CspA family protein
VKTTPQITFKNIQSSEAMEALIEKRLGRLERFHPVIISARVVVEVPHKSPGSGKNPIGLTVEVEVPGRKLVAKGEEESRETKNGNAELVVGRVFTAMERQLEDEHKIRQRRVKMVEEPVEAGKIAQLFREQRYGFVESGGGADLYFTENALQGLEFDELEVGMMVAITAAHDEGPMGPQARSVRKLGDDAHMPGT